MTEVDAGRDSRATNKLGPGTRLGTVTLAVRDLDAMSAFYEGSVGLERLEDARGRRLLGSGGRALLELLERPDLPPAPRDAAGLYHTAFLFEERSDLAAALYAAATGSAGRFVGSADHLVSLAFYFDDPDGNGVELYWDRPREEWTWNAGQVAMDSLPLDPNAFIREHHPDPTAAAAPTGAAVVIGHVHLKVGDLAPARAFYVDGLGFDVTTEMWQSALFVSAGGYHHHLGMNVWESRNAPVRGDTLGLRSFEVVVDPAELAAVRSRLPAVVEDEAGRLAAKDPWGTGVVIREADEAEAQDALA